jgi:hypothetical protein
MSGWKMLVEGRLESMLTQFGKNVPGMFEVGTRVVKVEGEPGDYHRPGAGGKIIAVIPRSFLSGEMPHFPGAYFVEWDDLPRSAVGFVTATKLRRE